MQKRFLFICVFTVFINFSIAAQTHLSVPLGHPVYIVLEQAQMRGLYRMLPHVKPYSRAQILSFIDEILVNNENRRFGSLTDAERRILEQFKQDFTPARDGLDLIRGAFSSEHIWNDIYFSSEFGIGLDMNFAGSYFSKAGGYRYEAPKEPEEGEEEIIEPFGFYGAKHPSEGDYFDSFSFMPKISFSGDLGRNTSYNLTISGWAGKAARTVLGTYRNLWDGYEGTLYNELTTYSEPLAYFPFSYKNQWDSFVWPVGEVSSSGQVAWPNDSSFGFSMMSEFAASLLNGHAFFRFARINREWGGMTANSSIVFNQSAQPFMAFETVIQPFEWISFSSLTGILEFHNATGAPDGNGQIPSGIKETAETFQNAFSIVMFELNAKNYFHFGLGSTVVWPTRFGLSYIFPFSDNLMSQNLTGDFDNMALFLNLQTQYPGIGKLWFSFFLDEMNLQEIRGIFNMDRQMYAYQFGGSFHIPWMPFSSVTASYTKVEPYNYSHVRREIPGYNNLMHSNYVSFGKSLGHYIPPNSDEFLVRFEMLPTPRSMISFQYQLIRHGANYGNRAVDGSSLWSELDPWGEERSNNPALKKHFLRDGAYQWMNILKLRGEFSLTGWNLPVKMFAEVGSVFSYFTDIYEGENLAQTNSGNPFPFRVIDEVQYPQTTRFIGVLGFQIFPKF